MRDLACYKLEAPAGALMVEQHAVATKHVMRFTIIEGQIITRYLADSVRAAWMKRSRLALGHLTNFAEHFARTRKVKTAVRLHLMKRREQVMGAAAIGIHRRETVFEALGYKALSRQMIALIKLGTGQDMEEARIAL